MNRVLCILGILLGILPLATTRGAGPSDATKGGKYSKQFWTSAVVVIAKVEEVPRPVHPWGTFVIQPLATISGKFDAANSGNLTIRTTAGFYNSELPREGDHLVLVLQRVDPRLDNLDPSLKHAPQADCELHDVHIGFSNAKGPIYRFERMDDPNVQKFRDGIRKMLSEKQ